MRADEPQAARLAFLDKKARFKFDDVPAGDYVVSLDMPKLGGTVVGERDTHVGRRAREQSSDVLVWRDGEWKAVFTQETEIFKP